LAVEAAGVDIVLATGFEAGGHRSSFLKPADDSLHGSLPLAASVLRAVRIPAVIAGGIASAEGVTAALELGAGAVQIGTAFLACDLDFVGGEFTHMKTIGPIRGATPVAVASFKETARKLAN